MGQGHQKKPSSYKLTERVLDAASTTGMGAASGAGVGAVISRIRYGAPAAPLRMVHPNDKQLKSIQSAVIGKIKTMSALARGAAIGGGAGLAYGAYRATRKDGKPMPDTLQVPGVMAAAGVGAIGLKNKGKVLRALSGRDDIIDLYRGVDETIDIAKGNEKWISPKKFKDMSESKVVMNEELLKQMHKKYGPITVSTAKNDGKGVAGKSIDDIWDVMDKGNSEYIKNIGGDPEAKVYMRLGGKRLSIDINPDFTGKNIGGGKYTEMLKTPEGIEYGVVRDMSVGGYELTTAPTRNPEDFFKNINSIAEDVQRRMGKSYDFSHPAIGPSPYKDAARIADRRMAGGHIHIQSKIDDGLKYKYVDGAKVERTESEMREVLARRAAFVSMPFDMTHKAMPYRSGLYGRTKDTYNEPYGINLVSSRTMNQKPSWEPDPGYINFEHRVSPTYINSDPKLNAKKVKLMQIVNSNPEVAKYVDDAMDDIVKATKNETQAMYLPEVRKMVADKYRGALGKGGVSDADIDTLLDKYVSGELIKTSEDKSEHGGPNVPLIAAGVAAPLASLAAYKYFRRAPKAPTKLQEAAKEGLTVVTSPGLSKRNKFINKILVSPDIVHEKVRKKSKGYVGNQVYKGVVFHKSWTNDKYPVSRVSGDITINPPTMHSGRVKIIDKSKLRDLPGVGDLFGKTNSVENLLQEAGISKGQFAKMTDDQAERALMAIEESYVGKGKGFLKPIEGEAMGKGTSNIYAPVAEARTKRLTKPQGIMGALRHRNKPYLASHQYGLSGIRKNPEKYIMQENINPDAASREYRIHTINGNVLDSVRRFGALEGAPAKAFASDAEKREFESRVKKLLAGIPEFSDYTDKRQVALAFDAVRDAGGKLRMIEINPNSGFVFPYHSFSTKPFDYYSTHKMYKHITGRDSGYVAGLKGLAAGVAAGGAVGAGTYAATEKKAASREGRDNKIAPYLYGTAAGLGVGAAAYALYRKPWQKGKLYELVPSNWANNPKGRGSIVKLTREDIAKKTLTPQDAIYANYPARMNSDELAVTGLSLGGAKRIGMQKELKYLINKKETYEKLPTYSKHLPKVYAQLSVEEIQPIRELVDKNRLNEAITEYNKLMAAKNGLPSGTNFFVKEIEGHGSRGMFFPTTIPKGSKKERDLVQHVYDSVADKKFNISPARQWKKLVTDPDAFIAQEMIPGGRELRVATHNGKIIKYIDRHGLVGAGKPRQGLSKEQVDMLAAYVKKVEGDLSKDMARGQGGLYLGHDIIIPGNAPLSPRLIETNTQEGYYAINPNTLYKSIFNRDTGAAALGKSVAIGTPTALVAGAIAGHKNHMRKKEYNNDK